FAVSDTYMDVFGEGLYAGKGIFDVAAFDATLRGAVPDNAILSHDLFEGGKGRAGLVTDIVLFESVPTRFLEYLQRQRRWIRGDWQLLPFLRGHGLSWVARWAAAQNLLRSLAPVAYLASLAVAFLAPLGSPVPWVLVTLLLLGAPYLIGMFNALLALRGAPAGNGNDSVGAVRVSDRRGPLGLGVELARWGFETML